MHRISARMPRRVAVFAAVALMFPINASQAAAPADPDLAFAMSVDVGRLDTMVSKAEEVIDEIAGTGALPNPGNSREDNDATLGELKLVVLRYNILVESACHADRLRAELCGQLYLPGWLNAAPGTSYDQARLQTIIGEATSRIVPFWNAICAKGKIATGDARFCELE